LFADCVELIGHDTETPYFRTPSPQLLSLLTSNNNNAPIKAGM
jgi:hypothetical protein